jgi:hypothetical protein
MLAGRPAEAASSIAQTKHLLALLAHAPAAMTRYEPASVTMARQAVCASSYCTSAKTRGATCKHSKESHAATGFDADCLHRRRMHT